MVSFAFTDEQEEFAKTLADFSRRELLPGYRDRAASTAFPFDVLRKLGELGVLGIGLPEEYGGTGDDDPVLGASCHAWELSRRCVLCRCERPARERYLADRTRRRFRLRRRYNVCASVLLLRAAAQPFREMERPA